MINHLKTIAFVSVLGAMSWLGIKTILLQEKLSQTQSELKASLTANENLHKAIELQKEAQDATIKALNDKYLSEVKQNELIEKALNDVRTELGNKTLIESYNELNKKLDAVFVKQKEFKKQKTEVEKIDEERQHNWSKQILNFIR